MAVNTVPAETFPIPPTAHAPNSDFPVVIYRGALNDRTVEGALAAIETTEWPKGGHWKIAREAVAATPHYHATTHEAYTVLHGTGTYRLGKSPLDPDTDADSNPVGVTFTARAGDVFAFPAGVVHCVVDVSGDYEIIGFYSLNERNSREEPYDMEYALDSEEETRVKRERCRQVPAPVNDPIYGKDGPIPRIWSRR